jgi:uncharacterized phage protein gp47/JayE
VTASVIGEVANDLAGDLVAPITALAFVADVTLDAPTGGGTERETDDDYQDRGSRELELGAKTLVTGRDYEIWALSRPGIGRAVATADVPARTIEVTVVDPAGDVVATADKTALAADYEANRLSNWIVTIADATYTPVSITYAVRPYPGFDTTDLVARIDAALQAYLSADGFGRQKTTGETTAATRTWLPDNVVRRNKLIDLIGDVDGVDYVDSLTITGAGGDGNRTLPGTVALPTPGTMTGSVV